MAGRAYGFIGDLSSTPGGDPVPGLTRRGRGSRSPPPSVVRTRVRTTTHATPARRTARQDPAGRSRCQTAAARDRDGAGRRPGCRGARAPPRRRRRGAAQRRRATKNSAGGRSAGRPASRRRPARPCAQHDPRPARDPVAEELTSTPASSATTMNRVTATGTNAGGSTELVSGVAGGPRVDQVVLEDDAEHGGQTASAPRRRPSSQIAADHRSRPVLSSSASPLLVRRRHPPRAAPLGSRSMTTEHPSITRFRDDHARRGGTGEVVILPDSVHTAALAAEALGCEVGAIANSLLFDADGVARAHPHLRRAPGRHRARSPRRRGRASSSGRRPSSSASTPARSSAGSPPSPTRRRCRRTSTRGCAATTWCGRRPATRRRSSPRRTTSSPR